MRSDLSAPSDRRRALLCYSVVAGLSAMHCLRRFLPLSLLLIAATPFVSGYSVLTHQAIIDSSWDRALKPLLLARYPGLSEDDLRKAHAYAYGGAIVQDMGYYPFGSRFFSDLVHYARSGDFIEALLRDSQDYTEFAFALGALAHYAADNQGHPIAVNRVVPMLYPKLRARYGAIVTYEEDPAAHLKTEFGFDVIEVAKGSYASQAYHDLIGFEVAQRVLQQAIEDTYSLPFQDLLRNPDLALGTYRYAVSKLIPEMTKTAWSAKKDEILKSQAGMTRQKFVYRMTRASYEKEWDKKYERPGFGARFLAFLFRIIPKVGPFKALAFRVPSADGEKLFLSSFDATLRQYLTLLDEVKARREHLVNENFYIGRPTRWGEYRMADAVYAKLLEHLAGVPTVSSELRANILAFYGASGTPASEKARVELDKLRAE